MTAREMRVYNFISDHGPCSTRQIADALSIQPFQAVNQICNRLAEEGLLHKDVSQRPHLFSILANDRPQEAGTKGITKQSSKGTPQVKNSEKIDGRDGQKIKPKEPKDLIFGKKVLFIIPCCAEKRSGGDPDDNNPAHNVHALIGDLGEGLNDGRQRALEIAHGVLVNIGIEFGVPADRQVLPLYRKAHERYNGKLYNTRKDGWSVKALLKDSEKSKNILIMSALYGLITPSDFIQDYDLEMKRTSAIWATTLPQIIDACATRLKVDMIVGLFATASGQRSYSYVFGQLANRTGIPAYMIHTRGRGTSHILQGLGYMLLDLVQGIDIPNNFTYDVVRVRPFGDEQE